MLLRFLETGFGKDMGFVNVFRCCMPLELENFWTLLIWMCLGLILDVFA